jgi:hypothetical protein
VSRATTYDKQRTKALRKLLTTPMRSADVVAYFGGDKRYSYQLHNLVAAGEVVNLNPVPKSPGLFVLATHAPEGAAPKVAPRRVGRPPGSGKARMMELDFKTGAHLHQVWASGGAGDEVRA